MSLLSGARTEELRALTWDHLNLDGQPDAQPVGAENAVTSCDLDVLVYERVSSERPGGRSGVWWGVVRGRALMQRSVRTVRVVKSVRGAVPVFRPARFPGPLPDLAVRPSPQRALRKSQVGPPALLVQHGLNLPNCYAERFVLTNHRGH